MFLLWVFGLMGLRGLELGLGWLAGRIETGDEGFWKIVGQRGK